MPATSDYDADPDVKARLRFTLDRDQLYRLTDLSPIEDAVIMTMLRNYSGLLWTMSSSTRTTSQAKAGLTTQQVYLVLKGLSMRRIVHFIPQRRMPTITYLTDRVETSPARDTTFGL